MNFDGNKGYGSAEQNVSLIFIQEKWLTEYHSYKKFGIGFRSEIVQFLCWERKEETYS